MKDTEGHFQELAEHWRRQTARLSPAIKKVWRSLRRRRSSHEAITKSPSWRFKRLTASGRRIEIADRTPFDRPRLVAFTLICRG
jgi:hypothetical protein